MKLIGLTGGIASGKSTVGRLLRDAGVAVIDADVLAREAVAPGSPGLAAITARFGATVLDDSGALDRKKLGAIVFGDAAPNVEARRELNAIVHPEVGRLAAERLAALREAGAAVAVYEVPLLFEGGLEAMMDTTILVACPEPVQLARVMARDQLAEAQAAARIKSQMSLEEKRRRAGYTIENDGDLAALRARTAAVFEQATGVALTLP